MKDRRLRTSQIFSIADKKVGKNCPVFIIAEAGVAHFGSAKKALKLVDLASSAGADAVKFQIFETNSLISKESPEWRERLVTKELPQSAFVEIQQYCQERGIIFLATAHDDNSLVFLESLNVPAYKIGSGEVANWPFLQKVASLRKPIIFSTGMYKMDDIRQAVTAMLATDNRDLAALHCVTSYPTPAEEVNLRAIQTISREFDMITGYSDHTRGFHFPLAAVALGARIIEKHITLDFDVPNSQDWKVSCGPDDLHLMVEQIREIETGLGTGEKNISASERASIAWARKSIVASRDLRKGETVSLEAIAAKRPGTGIPPSDIEKIVGRVLKKDISRDSLLQWEHFE